MRASGVVQKSVVGTVRERTGSREGTMQRYQGFGADKIAGVFLNGS
jgi:hypothetical protein